MNACRHCGRKGRGYRAEPGGYVAWQEWADKMSETHRQEPCPGCGRFSVWVAVARASDRSLVGAQPDTDSSVSAPRKEREDAR